MNFLRLFPAAAMLLAATVLPEVSGSSASRIIVKIATEDSLRMNAGYFPTRSGAGPFCLLLHDRGSEGAPLGFVAAALNRRGIHVILPDLRGHGLSYDRLNPLGTFDDYSNADLIALLADDLLAYSNFASRQEALPDSGWTVMAMGESALVALDYLQREPRVRRLVLISPLLPSETNWPSVREDAELLLLACDGDERSREDLVRLYLELPEGGKRMDLLACKSRGRGLLRQQPELLDRISEWMSR